MTLRFAAVVFCALAVLARHVVQGPGASAGSAAGRQADLGAIEKFHQQDIAATLSRDPVALTEQRIRTSGLDTPRHRIAMRTIQFPAARLPIRVARVAVLMEQRSPPDTPDGDSHLLLALGLTMESSPAFAEVVIRRAARIVV